MAKTLLSVLFWMLCNINYGQSGIITGTILSDNDTAIANATIIVVDLKRNTISGMDGKFLIANINYGTYQLKISVAGYHPFKTSITVNEKKHNINIKLKANIIDIEEVVISGTLKQVSRLSSPIAVEVYSPAFFKKNPSPNIFESLQMVNGIQPQLNCNVCNTGDIHINGMEGPYTMILIDGMPIVSSLSTVYGLAGIPNSMVKRIEIVKGPASTLYGSEAVGGLINIITKDGNSGEPLKIDFSTTHFGELNADITSAVKFKKSSALLGINYFNFQQRRDINSDNFTDLALQQRLSIFNKWNFTLGKNNIASIGARYITENRWGGEMNWKPAFKGGDSIYGETIKTNRVELLGTTSISSQLNFDLSYNYHLQDSYYGTVKYFANQHVAFAQIRWNKTIGRHDLLAGIPIRYTYYDDNSPTTATSTGQNNASKILLPGIFLQDEIKINSNIILLSGLRYDYNNQHGNIFSPRIALKISTENDHTIRLSGGNGFRVVNLFTEDHAALSGAREVIIANTLKPEKSWNANINYNGFIRHNKGFINIDASTFYTYFSNKIVGDFITDPNKIIYDNIEGYAISKGFTINTDFNFTSGLKIISGITLMDVYQIGNDENGKQLKTPQLFAPSFSGTFAISYLWPKRKLGIDITGRVNGPMELPVVPNDFRPSKSPWFGIVNLQATKKLSDLIEIYGGIKNLLNFIPINPLLHADDPFDKAGGKYFDANGLARNDTNPFAYNFDPSYNYAPIQGAKLFLGIRWQLK